MGTGSYKNNHITRVYILQEYQGRGYGRFIMHAIEQEMMKKHHKVYLDASRPGIPFYEKLGYRTAKHEEYETADGVVLAYEVMEKLL